MRRSWDSYRLLLQWQFFRMRSDIALLVVIQIVLAVGVVYGLGLLLPNIDHQSALYLSTGAPTIGLIVLGLAVVPQEVAQARLTGRQQYIAGLPVPLLAPLAADVTWWLGIQLPGTALALVAASVRFHVHLQVGWTVVPAIVLVALTGATVGHALASTFRPQVAMQVASFLSIIALLYSPINFPPDRMPTVLQAIHRVLPIEYMADVVRGSLTGQHALAPLTAFTVVAVWCVAGLAVSARAALRRP